MKKRKIEEKTVYQLFVEDPIVFDLLSSVDLDRAVFQFNDCIESELEYIRNFAKEKRIDCQIITNKIDEAYLIDGLVTDGYNLQIILL